MTDEQINAAIARECGWKDVWRCQGVSETASFVGTSPENEFIPVPNYCTDLNAMHEAEEALKGKQFAAYAAILGDRDGTLYGIRATARQRAEAFLRTLRKWEVQDEDTN
jgi:hypothetical protein